MQPFVPRDCVNFEASEVRLVALDAAVLAKASVATLVALSAAACVVAVVRFGSAKAVEGANEHVPLDVIVPPERLVPHVTEVTVPLPKPAATA